MNAQKVRKTFNWGRISCKRLKGACKNGARPYGAHFRVDYSEPLGWTTVYIHFWARRPILAKLTD